MKPLKEQVYLMNYELGQAGNKALRKKSAGLNKKSLYKEGEMVDCIFTSEKVKIHMILGKGRCSRSNLMSYLVELADSDIHAAHWIMTKKEKLRYGCHLSKRYTIVLEPWLKK